MCRINNLPDNYSGFLSSSKVYYIIIIVSIIGIVIIILFDRKRLFDKVHYFVHLNLAFTLLLANLVFVSGIETATANEVC